MVSTTVVPLVRKNIQTDRSLGLKSAHRATGKQIYRCTGGRWVFDHPEADSTRYVGCSALGYHHDRSPVWTEDITGYTICGHVVAGAGGTTSDIPRLLPRVVEKTNPEQQGSIYSEVDFIQRLDTVGGTANLVTTSCTAANDGAFEDVGYSALYVMYGQTG